MTVGIATVLSARDWEPGLVAFARSSAAIRVVVRAFQPQDIDRYSADIDVVVAGGEVSWVTPAHLASWRQGGLGVVGVVPQGDEPAADLLLAGGASEVVPDTITPEALVQVIRFVAPTRPEGENHRSGKVVSVLGARGAPGATEVAIAYALACSDDRATVLVDADVDGPSVAIRMGLPPRPDVTDAIDHIRGEGSIDTDCIQYVRGLAVIVGSHRPGEPPMRMPLLEGVIRAAASRWSVVVADVGASQHAAACLEISDEAILVVDGSAVGIVRAAQLVETWIGPAPALVLNRTTPSARSQTVEAVRRWTGLEPTAIVSDRHQVRRAASAGRLPDRRFARAVGGLGRPQ